MRCSRTAARQRPQSSAPASTTPRCWRHSTTRCSASAPTTFAASGGGPRGSRPAASTARSAGRRTTSSWSRVSSARPTSRKSPPRGADGMGLSRTELRSLEARHWPTVDDHRRQLAAVLGGLAGATATVRLLDFGGDKTPPFLDGTRERGIALLLSHPDALADQLRAIVEAAAHTHLRLLLPMVETPDQLRAVRAAVGARDVELGAMIETAAAVEQVHSIAAAADFISIGTNDLTHSVLTSDRFSPGASV